MTKNYLKEWKFPFKGEFWLCHARSVRTLRSRRTMQHGGSRWEFLSHNSNFFNKYDAIAPLLNASHIHPSPQCIHQCLLPQYSIKCHLPLITIFTVYLHEIDCSVWLFQLYHKILVLHFHLFHKMVYQAEDLQIIFEPSNSFLMSFLHIIGVYVLRKSWNFL